MRRLAALLMLLVMFMAVTASAQGVQQKPPQRMGYQALNLTEEQQDKVADLRFEWQKERTMIQADRRLAQLDLDKLMADPNASESQLKDLLDKVSNHSNKLILGQRALHMAIRNELTPEQQKIWDDMNTRRMNVNRRPEGLRNARRPMRGGTMDDRMQMHRDFGRQGLQDMRLNPRSFRERFWRDDFSDETIY